jgi:hypothetical protein
MAQKVSRPRIELRTFCVLDRCDNQLRHRPDTHWCFHCVRTCFGVKQLSCRPLNLSKAILRGVRHVLISLPPLLVCSSLAPYNI